MTTETLSLLYYSCRYLPCVIFFPRVSQGRIKSSVDQDTQYTKCCNENKKYNNITRVFN